MSNNLLQTFGEIDIYLFDQLLKGRFDNCRTILDAGCGYGRNIHYFLSTGYDVFGIDNNQQAIEEVQRLAERLSPGYNVENFKFSPIEEMPFTQKFNLVICSAVLHFAKNAAHFNSMVRSCWDALLPGGYFFARLASDIGIEDLVVPVGEGRYRLPDGSERYLANMNMLSKTTRELNGTLYEPIKTTNVHNLRCMTTWCVRKN